MLEFGVDKSSAGDLIKDVNEDSPTKGPSTVNNALFVGSTAELAKLLKNGAKQEDK